MIPGPFRIVATTELGSDASTITLSDFSGIPSGSRHLVLMLNARASSGTPAVYLRFNSDSGSNYNYHSIKGASSTKSTAETTNATQIVVQSQLTSTANMFGGGITIIPRYTGTSYQKSTLTLGGDNENTVEQVAGRWASTAAITRVDFVLSSNNFVAGSVAILAVMDETYLVHEVERASTGTIVLNAAGSEEDLVVVGYMRSTRITHENDGCKFVINSDTNSANYSASSFFGHEGSLTAYNVGNELFAPTADLAPAGRFGVGVALISQSSNGTNYPAIHAVSGFVSSFGLNIAGSARRANTAAITTIELDASNGDMTTGSFASLYRLPRNRIHNTDLGSSAATIGGTVTSSSDAIFASVYGRTNNAGAFDGLKMEVIDDTTASNYSRQRLWSSGATVAADSSSASRDWVEMNGNGVASNNFGGGTQGWIKYTKTDRHKHCIAFSGSGTVPMVLLGSNRWKNTSAITKLEASVINGTLFLAGTQFQVEGLELSPATPATSGFFFRFLSIAAPTVGLAAASSYLSWLTNVSA